MRIYIYILKTIAFLFIFCLLWNLIFNILWLNKNPIVNFYDEPKNSLDIVYIGSSNAYAHFNTTLAYEKYGFTTGMFATDAVPFVSTKNSLIEINKYQNPQLYIIDLAKLPYGNDTYNEGDIRGTVDSFKFSANRINLINNLMNYTDNLNSITDKKSRNKYDLYFSFFLYHNKWKSITKDNINNDVLYKGYLFSKKQTEVYKSNKYMWDYNKIQLQENNRENLEDLLNYINNKKLNVIFTIPIRQYDKNINDMLNTATEIIEDYGYKVINFNILDDFDVDFATDFYDIYHLNVYGATKYTLYFSKYLKENYDLPDHRNDKKYSSWDSEYERFKMKFKELTNKNFDDLLIDF